MDALDLKHLGETRVDERIGRVVVRDKIGRDGLGSLLSLAEAIELLFPLIVVKASGQSVHLLLDRNTNELGVKENLVLEGAVKLSQAIV